MNDTRTALRAGDKLHAMAWVGRYISPLIAPADRVLEVGCGRGVVLVELARSHVRANVIGVEASEKRLRQATRRCAGFPNVCVQPASATSLPFPDDSFDLVFSRLAIERLLDKARAASEMVRVCRPGGTVLLQDRFAQPVSYRLSAAKHLRPLDRLLASSAIAGRDSIVE